MPVLGTTWTLVDYAIALLRYRIMKVGPRYFFFASIFVLVMGYHYVISYKPGEISYWIASGALYGAISILIMQSLTAKGRNSGSTGIAFAILLALFLGTCASLYLFYDVLQPFLLAISSGSIASWFAVAVHEIWRVSGLRLVGAILMLVFAVCLHVLIFNFPLLY